MDRRGFLKFLGLAPAIPAVLKGMDWDRPAEAVPMPVLSKQDAAGMALLPHREDHVHPAVPPGTIMPFNGHNIPDGWLPCDGRAEYIKTYPKLYEAIGSTYGRGGADLRTFRLPDMRGSYTTQENSSHNHGMTPELTPSSHAHTFANANHTHHALWFHPATYMIKT